MNLNNWNWIHRK